MGTKDRKRDSFPFYVSPFMFPFRGINYLSQREMLKIEYPKFNKKPDKEKVTKKKEIEEKVTKQKQVKVISWGRM